MRIINLLTESLYSTLLMEAKSKDEVCKILCSKYDSIIKPFIIKNIINLDHTKKFSYSQWALKCIANSNDTYNVDYVKLEELFSFASKNNDFQLQTFNSIGDAFKGMKDYNLNSELKNNYNVIFNDSEWIVYQPLCYEAERYIVWHIYNGTRWCTTSGEDGEYDGREMYDRYTNDGRLFIFARKKDNALFQLSDGQKEIKDENNKDFTLDEMQPSDNLINYFKNQLGIDFPKIIYDNNKELQEEFYAHAEQLGDSGLYLFSMGMWTDYRTKVSPDNPDFDESTYYLSAIFCCSYIILAKHYFSQTYDVYINETCDKEHMNWNLAVKNVRITKDEHGAPYSILIPKSTDGKTLNKIIRILKQYFWINHSIMSEYDNDTYEICIDLYNKFKSFYSKYYENTMDKNKHNLLNECVDKCLKKYLNKNVLNEVVTPLL